MRRKSRAPKLTTAEKLDMAKRRAKQLAQQTTPRITENLDQEFIDAHQMMQSYEKALGEFKNNKAFKYLKNLSIAETKAHKNYSSFVRAAQFAKELDVNFDTYIKAQFYYFNKHFNKAPKVRHIASYRTKVPAKERVRLFLRERNSATDKKVAGPVVSAPKIPDSVKARYSERQLKEFMKNYRLTEKEVFIKFAKGKDAYLYFDRSWLLKNQTYKSLKDSGEV